MSSEKVHPQNGYYSDPMHSARVLFGWYLILKNNENKKKTQRPEIPICNLYTINPHKTNENHRETPTSNSRNMLNFQSSIILKFQNHQTTSNIIQLTIFGWWIFSLVLQNNGRTGAWAKPPASRIVSSPVWPPSRVASPGKMLVAMPTILALGAGVMTYSNWSTCCM